MKVISFDVDDPDQIQAIVTQPLGDVDPWELRYAQIQSGPFDGRYAGTALPSPIAPAPGEMQRSLRLEAETRGTLLCESAVYASRQRYGRRLSIRGRAPDRFIAFVIPLDTHASSTHRGQTMDAEQLLALSPGDELDSATPAGWEFLSLNVHPRMAERLQHALHRPSDRLPSGILRPPRWALRALKEHLCGWVRPSQSTSGTNIPRLRALAEEVEDRLGTVLELSVESPLDTGLRHRRRIVSVARDYLAAHCDRQVGISELCAVTGATRRTLFYAFKTYLGISPIAYHAYQRLRLARDDLRQPRDCDVTVAQVARSRGFQHLGRFSRDFRLLHGQLPNEALSGR